MENNLQPNITTTCSTVSSITQNTINIINTNIISKFSTITEDLKTLSSIKQGQKLNIYEKTTIRSTGLFQSIYRYLNSETRIKTKLWLEKLSKNISLEILIMNSDEVENRKLLKSYILDSINGLKNLCETYNILNDTEDICNCINIIINEFNYYIEKLHIKIENQDKIIYSDKSTKNKK